MLLQRVFGGRKLSTDKVLRIGIAFGLSCVLLSTLFLFPVWRPSFRSSVVRPDIPRDQCTLDVATLKSLELSGSIHYARCNMIVVHSPANHFSGQLDLPLPEFHALDLDANQTQDNNSSQQIMPDLCNNHITIHVPKPARRPDASHVIFGLATTVERLDESLEAFAHWAAHTNTRLFAIVPPHADKGRVEQKAKSLGFDLEITESEAAFEDRYFALVKLLFERRNTHTEWAAFIDDDTFFLSMKSLIDRLGDYDPMKDWYIGALSEDLVQMHQWGFMAYGGGGIFISIPLLVQMNKAFDACNVPSTGDQRIAGCIYKHTTTKLTIISDLHQVDLHEDASGFYESGRSQPLSVHHWKSWFHHDMGKASVVASVCGDACLLHRWRFSDGWFLTNGFSLVKYSYDRSLDDIAMEKTWIDIQSATDEAYSHSLAPLHPKDERKISLVLKAALREGNRVRQFYIDRSQNRVLEVVWGPG